MPSWLRRDAQPAVELKPVDPEKQAQLSRELAADLFFYKLKGFSVQLIFSGGSGLVAKTAVAPLERIKVSSWCCSVVMALVAMMQQPWSSQASLACARGRRAPHGIGRRS